MRTGELTLRELSRVLKRNEGDVKTKKVRQKDEEVLQAADVTQVWLLGINWRDPRELKSDTSLNMVHGSTDQWG